MNSTAVLMAVADGESTLQWPDYLVIGIVLSISASIGIYYRFTGGRQRTAEEYFSADRSMSVVPLSIALMVSFMSAVTLLGISAENYVYGTQFTLIYLGYGIGTPIAIYLYLPVFFELRTMSVFEYLQRRFGRTARMVASVTNFTHLMLYTGVVLFAPSLALEATTGLSVTTSILLIGVICTFYSTIGGIKAVLITDVFQGLLMFAAIVCVLGVAATDVEDGFSGILRAAYEGGRIDYSDFRIDPTVRHTWPGLLIGGCCMFLSLYGVNQVQIQRLLTTRSLESSQRSLLLNWPLTLIMGFATAFAGVSLYAVYKDCDPMAAGRISSSDKIMPYFTVERMTRYPGLSGLFISGVFSASLSTISAMLNSLAAVALEDYIKPIYARLGGQFPDDRATLIGKFLATANGLVCVLLAFLTGRLGSIAEAAISITGALGGPLLGIFSLGMFTETANEAGSVIGTIAGLFIGLWAVFGEPKPIPTALPVSTEGCEVNSTFLLPQNDTLGHLSNSTDESSYFYLYRISYVWYTPLGFVITVTVGYLASLILCQVCGKDSRELDPRLFTPPLASRVKRRRQNASKTTDSQLFVLDSNLVPSPAANLDR